MSLFAFGRSGDETLRAWLRRRAKKAGQILAIEEALLAGRFSRYAFRRLSGFFASRFWATVLHVIELTWLARVFSAKPFIASLALQNATLVLDAFFFGALEALRRRARALGPSTEASAVTTRWLTLALWLALLVLAAPLVRAIANWNDTNKPPSLLELYAGVCALRLASDVVLRTYYSGVFAFHRVYRPLWMPLVAPTIIIGGAAALWGLIGPFAFAASLAASVVLTRALLFVYSRRAYRLRRVPRPRWILRPRRIAWPDRVHVREAVLAGFANTTARLGSVILVAAIIPSLVQGDVLDDENGMAPFAFALHLAAPLLFLAGQWWLVFYHDWNRLAGDAAGELAAALHWKLLATAVIVGLIAWAGASGLVLLYVPFDQTWQTLLALAPAMFGMSVWTAFQLRAFVRGEFFRQLASAVTFVVVLVITISGEWLGNQSWYVALGIAPWVAIVVAVVLARIRHEDCHGEMSTIGAWLRALDGLRDEKVTVWLGRGPKRTRTLTARIVEELGDRGAVVQSSLRLLWFETEPRTSTREWLTHTHGALSHLECLGTKPAREQRRALEDAGILRAPESLDGGDRELAATHARLFPEGFVLEVGRRPPAAFLELPEVSRQAIWRDAVRARHGVRGRSPYFVTVRAPDGPALMIYVAKRPIESKVAAEWHAVLARAGWRVAGLQR